MVRSDLAGHKVARALAWLEAAERRFGQPRERFLADIDGRDLALFHLFLAIQECVDLAAHWIADDGLPPADDYASAFTVLAEQGRIDPALADGMKGAVGLRSRIAHGYAMLDYGRIHDEARAGEEAIRRFLTVLGGLSGGK
jgi:uncharacterized protein YutE (UPF0331/DUF86 family)